MLAHEVVTRIWKSVLGHGSVRNRDYPDRDPVAVVMISVNVLRELTALSRIDSPPHPTEPPILTLPEESAPMSPHEPNDRAWTGADDITELGGLSADERDQLAVDLQREQQAVDDIGDLASALRRQMEAEQRQRYGTDPTATTASRSETHQREHVTDGFPCWCEPTIENYRAGNRPDGLRAGSEADPDPWDVDRVPLRPLNDQVFLVRVQPLDRTASGLAIPESAQSKGCECRVLAAGPGAKHARTGERIPMSVVAGDHVVIGKWQGNEVTIPDYVRAAWGIDDREPVIVVRETDILAVLVPASEVCA